MRFVLVLALACSGLGCGGSGGGGGGGSGGTGGGSGTMDMAGGGGGGGTGGGCTFTLSGANSATGSCTVNAGYDPPSNSNPGTAIAFNTGGSVFAFGSQLSTGNDFTAGKTYDQGNVVNAAGESLSGTSAWQVIKNNVNGMPDQGSFTLTLSSTGPVVTASNGAMVWSMPHGTLNATMPADPGATGTVTAQVTF
jgi:hypothetical protein